ncbi:MAG: MFS transporter [Thermoplasmata archaeon]|nr:MFS transporter [Thermoplasmata archaeon]
MLFLARIAYAFSWYNIGAVLPLIGGRFGAGTDALGVVLGAFLAGAGLFQVPAGFAAIRWGNRNSSIFGLLLMGGACVLSAFAPDLALLAATRFLAGVGAAFFFAPGLSLISSYYPAGEKGPAIGLYNGAFNVGAGAGLVGGAFVGELFGWSAALLVGGGAILLAGAGVALLIPAETPRDRPRSRGALWLAGRGVLRSRSVWALATGLIGFWAVVNVVGLYFVEFAEKSRPSWGLGTAAAVAAGVVLISGVGGPIGGWLAERSRDRRLLVALFAGLTATFVVAIPLLALGPLLVLLLVLGTADGVVFAVQYLMPAYFPESSGDGAALAVGLINSVQVLVGSALTILFGVVAQLYGFPTAWYLSAFLGLAFLPLLLLIPRLPERLSLPRETPSLPS